MFDKIDENFLLTNWHFINQREYWLNKLAGNIGQTDILIRNRSDFVPQKDRETETVKIIIPGELCSRLMTLSSGADLSLYILLLAGLKILIHFYTGNEDVIVGSPIYRANAGERTINDFIALRDSVYGDLTFKEFLFKVRQSVLEGFENQDYPLDRLLESLFGTARKNVSLTNVVCLSENIHDTGHIPGMKDIIIFAFARQDEKIKGTVTFDPHSYDRLYVERIPAHFVNIVAGGLQNIDVKLSAIPFLSPQEERTLLFDLNKTATWSPPTAAAHGLFARRVEKAPGCLAVQYRDIQLTYGELNKRANQLGRQLRGEGIGPNDIAALMIDPSIEMIIGIMGILKAGGAYLPIDADCPKKRLSAMLKDSETRVLLSRPSLAGGIDAAAGVWDLEDGGLYAGEGNNLEESSRPGDLAYTIYTSGSTGNPNGVLIEHHSLVNLCFWHNRYYGVTARDRATQYARFSFDASVWEIFPYLIKGAGLHIISQEIRLDLAGLNDYYNRNDITISFLPTQVYEQFVKEENRSLRVLLVGGDKLDDFTESSYRLYNNYGPTENTVVATSYPVKRFLTNIPIGRPIDRVRIFVLNKENVQIQPVGVPGELCIAGPGLARGYLNRPPLSAEKFVDNPFETAGRMYRTGDLVRWTGDGNIEFLGRIDHQVKIRGNRVETGDIEYRLLKHEDIKEAIVVEKEIAGQDEDGGDGGERRGKYLCAYIVSGRTISVTSLREYLAQNLPDYMIPAYFRQIDQIPLTPNGKLDRQALPPPQVDIEGQYVAPGNEVEAKLAEIWAEVLGIPEDKIGIFDNFFELGGHSLKSTKLISKIYKELDKKVPLSVVFNWPTIRDLADYIIGSREDRYTPIGLVEEKEYYPLSSAQKRLVVLQQMKPESIIYNVPLVIGFKERFARDRFEKTFREIIARHESQRTSFDLVKDEPVQRIHRQVNFNIEYYDVTGEAQPGNRQRIEQVIDGFVRPFDLSKAPLMRVGLINTGGHRHILLVDMHHIITDGSSMEVYIEEFYDIYEGHELPEIQVQYKDFSQWQNRLIESGEIKAQEEYWLREFEGELSVLELPTDYPRPAVQGFEGRTLSFVLGQEETKGLKDLASAEQVTLYILMLAVFNVFLAKISRNEAITIGTPIAGRGHPDVQRIIGVFVNTLVLKNDPVGSKGFLEFLEEVKAKTVRAFENQDYQYEYLVEKLEANRDASRNPLFDVMYTLETREMSGKPGSYGYENRVSKFDLTLVGIDGGENLFFTLEYSTKLFKEVTIRRFIEYLKRVLSTIIENPAKKIAAIEVIEDREREQLLHDFNDTATGYPGTKTLPGLFEAEVNRAADRAALVDTGGVGLLSYRELNRRANRLARVLRQQGLETGTITGILLDPSVEMIVSLLAVLKAGGAYLPIDPEYPAERTKYMLSDSGAKILLTRDQYGDRVEDSVEILDVGQHRLYEGGMDDAAVVGMAGPEGIAYIIYTSGTSGRPKGTLTSHRNVIRVVKSTNYIELTGEDRLLQLSNFAFDGSVFDIYGALLNGASLLMMRRETVLAVDKLSDLIRRERITVFFVTTALFNALIDFDIDCFETVRTVLFGGEKVSLRHGLKAFEHLGRGRVIHVYGPTETTVFATYHPLDEMEKSANTLPIGKPLANTTAYILDKYWLPVPVGVAGEIYIGGDGVARGYLNNPELTADKFITASATSRQPQTPKSYILYRTGDLGRFLPDGSIDFLGRIDSQVKIRGFRIELEEIVGRLAGITGIKEVTVIDRQDENGQKYLCAYVVAAGKLDVPALRAELSAHLPGYMIPTHFVEIDKIPLTANGKIDKRSLPEPVVKPSDSCLVPLNTREAKLVEIWSEVLGIDKGGIGLDLDYFDLGGHSLNATTLILKIHKEFAVKIPLAEIFRNSTVRELANLIKESEKAGFEAIAAAEKKEYYVISSAQKRMYLLQQLDAANTNYYNMPFIKMFEGRLNRERLAETFARLIDRHESLRTSFEIVGDTPVQRIHGAVEFAIEYFEPAAGEFAEIQDGFVRPFCLSGAPLLRVGLICTHEERSILMVDMHHIISDGESLNILVHDFLALYYNQELPPLRIQYKDFAQWQNSQGPTEAVQRQKQYWLRELRGELPVLRLPTDYERGGEQNLAGTSLNFEIGKEETERLREIARSENVTMFMILFAIYNILLSRLCGQEDIIVGTPTVGRRHLDLKNLMGVFINTLAVRLFPRGELTFADFLKYVKIKVLDAFENQDYQFEELVTGLSIKRDSNRNPIFDVLFAFHTLDDAKIDEEMTAEDNIPIKFKRDVAHFDLVVFVTETADRLHCFLEYSTVLFRQDTIEEIRDLFVSIVDQVLGNKFIPLKDIRVSTSLTYARPIEEDYSAFNF
jgi:amino acid adenylation domain-containing protein